MEIIDALEPTKRGPYAGVVGYLDFSGNIDTAIAIRTLVVGDDGRASVQAGAGIVADSVPEHEDLECHNKARALLAAIPAARRMTARRRAHAGRIRLARWVASGPWGTSTCGPRWARCRSSGTSSRVHGPEAIDVPAGAAQPGRRRRWRSASRRRRSCSSPPARSTPGSASPGSPTTRSCSTSRPGFGEAVLARLARFKLRTKAELEASSTWSGLAVRGPGADADRAPRRARLAGRVARRRGVSTCCRDELALRPACRSSTPTALEALRIECGVPAMGAELTEATIPAEAGQWLIDASVSFTKGCYTGQELVARIDSRGGNVPGPLRGLLVDGEPVPVGTTVAGGRRRGRASSRRRRARPSSAPSRSRRLAGPSSRARPSTSTRPTARRRSATAAALPLR